MTQLAGYQLREARPITGRAITVLVVTLTMAAAACSSTKGSASPTTTGAPHSATTAASQSSILGPVSQAKGDPIKIGIISDGKSDANDISIEGRVATATATWLNQRRNGVAGHPIQLVECDTMEDPAKGTDCGNQMVEQKVSAVMIGVSTVTEQAWPPLHAAHVPVMIYATTGTDLLTDQQSTFILADPVSSAVELPLAVAKQSHTKSVAAIVIDVPQATDLFRTIAPPLFKKAGVRLQVIPIPLGTPDVTAQLQQLITNGTGEAFVVGNDALCITIFNGLRSVGYTGRIAAVAQCVTDNTRQAIAGDVLKGMTISAQTPIGTHDPSMNLYQAVMQHYGTNIALDDARGPGMFTDLTAFASALEGTSGELTPDRIISTIKAAPAKVLQASGGLTFKCNGKADPANPAVCAAGVLTAVLNDKGQPTAYKASNSPASK